MNKDTKLHLLFVVLNSELIFFLQWWENFYSNVSQFIKVEVTWKLNWKSLLMRFRFICPCRTLNLTLRSQIIWFHYRFSVVIAFSVLTFFFFFSNFFKYEVQRQSRWSDLVLQSIRLPFSLYKMGICPWGRLTMLKGGFGFRTKKKKKN